MPQAAVLTAPQILTIEDRPPQTPGEGEVIISVEHTGVCGTDLALFSGDYPSPLPLVCGHEFVGRVTELGKGVEAHWNNRRITAEINNSCTAYKRNSLCTACRKGIPGHCLNRDVTGIIQRDGAFAEQVRVPAGTLHEIPEDLDPLTAVLTEPLAAALQTFEMTPIKGNETIVVLGPGRLGILVVFIAALKGARVIACSRSQSKRKRALKFGASEAFDPENISENVMEITEGLGADMVVDVTGKPEGIDLAINLVRPRGVVSVKTTCGLPAKGINMTKLVVDEVQIQGSRCGPFDKALTLLSEHQNKLRPLITSVRPLKEAQDAVESAFLESKVVLAMPTDY
ncbi:MAG: alcohol dehydrogenase catalytic domain-containing protein [Candidatus Nitronauta litoralis]|uniref:Alcohol dehydrogenase catalytic domain-containing protein n=1 Tax=Candidatus Nitronauta litoralis TaxID=2705533 RepID=A0A7T0BYA4_9BACT|nr:MAG: alcohol dehydrogenase catalytic domain-containing protein [Candidatus Nitronauta litoralis]